ncbi:MAG: hypothetical protein ACRD3B_17600 [Candidatus Sulfotelmatobacter sp.]
MRYKVIVFLPLLVALAVAQVSSPAITAKHKTLYGTYHSNHDIARETLQGNNIELEMSSIEDFAVGPDEAAAPRYPSVLLRQEACSSDAVLVVTPKSLDSMESNITDSGDFLYTDYLMRVMSVLKGPDLKDLDIVVTRPGGRMTVNGHQVHIELTGLPQYQPNMRYLLFLHHLTEINTYQASSASVRSHEGKSIQLAVNAMANIGCPVQLATSPSSFVRSLFT